MSPTAHHTTAAIRRAGAGDRDAVAATLTAAFFDDPVIGWIVPDVERRRRVLEPLFRVYVDAYLPHDEVYLTDEGHGTAVWLPPGRDLLSGPQAEQEFAERVRDTAGPDADRLFELEEIFAAYHPAEPLYYCQFLATVPAFQSRGIGSAFLRDELARADRDGLPAYHEATTPRNRALYERHGYVNQGVFELPDGPPLWRMWREPTATT